MTSDRWTGRVIDGRYVVEATLGQGGMGVVLRARHRFTNAQVALKMLQPDLVTNPDAQSRFLEEARAPSTIGHPGIVQVLDAGKTPEGELYLAMELLAGRTLRHAMPAPAQVGRRVVLELLDALAAAHARGIVHRDLKPENVFLVGAAGTVKLLDFGIAKVVQGGYTAAGAVLGTPAYMAPEQLIDASTVDLRADLWAVGVILYELVSGQLPYRGAHLSELVQALATRDPDPIAAHVRVGPDVVAFFAQALARDRTRRFASSHDMARAVAALALDPPRAPARPAYGHPSSNPQLVVRSTTGGAPRSPPWMWIGLAGIAVLVGVLAVVAAIGRDESAATRDREQPRQASCEAGCAMLGDCGLAPPNCALACQASPALQTCVARGSCQEYAICMHAVGCGGIVPSGSESCGATIGCEAGCIGSVACTCGCIERMASQHAVALLRVNVCAFVSCGPAGSVECAQARCAEPIAACVAATGTP